MKKKLTVFGEALFDHFPNGSQVLGGAPFNVAWHLQAFGQSPRFISRVGFDAEGDLIRSKMLEWGMDVQNLQRDANHPTGHVQITIEHNEPTYSILANQAYDYIALDPIPPPFQTGLLYHGTLAIRSETSNQTLMDLKTNAESIFIDVNLRAPWWSQQAVLQCINNASWVKFNHQELVIFQEATETVEESMQRIIDQYHLKGIIVTFGAEGACALLHTGESYSVSPRESTNIMDTVGAGDAFSAVFLLGLNLEWTLAETMDRAQTFASAIVQQKGAIVENPDFYLSFMKSWL